MLTLATWLRWRLPDFYIMKLLFFPLKLLSTLWGFSLSMFLKLSPTRFSTILSIVISYHSIVGKNSLSPHSFMWTHRVLSYSMANNPSLPFIILLLKLSQIFFGQSFALETILHEPSSPSRVFKKGNCSRLLNYTKGRNH